MMNIDNKAKKSESENLKEKTEIEFTSQEVELDQKEEDNAITYELVIPVIEKC